MRTSTVRGEHSRGAYNANCKLLEQQVPADEFRYFFGPNRSTCIAQLRYFHDNVVDVPYGGGHGGNTYPGQG